MGGRRFDPFPARVQNLTLLQVFLDDPWITIDLLDRYYCALKERKAGKRRIRSRGCYLSKRVRIFCRAV